jgi:hypothetical protein
VYNNTGANATVVAWLDYDADGKFEPIEGVTRTVATNAAMQTITLAWPGIPVSLPLGTRTFLRIRVTSASNGMGVSNATRWYSNGEVEDYPVIVDVILPTELLHFTAQAEANTRVKLMWSTGKEIYFNGVEVERSKDGLNWKLLANVAANANGAAVNNYLLYDQNPEKGLNYYRLKLIAADGGYQYSEVRLVEFKQLNAGMKIIPNPARTYASVAFTLDRNEAVSIAVIDANGRKVIQKNISLERGYNKVALDNVQSLAPGTYVVQVITSNGVMNEKITKQ